MKENLHDQFLRGVASQERYVRCRSRILIISSWETIGFIIDGEEKWFFS